MPRGPVAPAPTSTSRAAGTSRRASQIAPRRRAISASSSPLAARDGIDHGVGLGRMRQVRGVGTASDDEAARMGGARQEATRIASWRLVNVETPMMSGRSAARASGRRARTRRSG
jgi:hypothetical protein